MRGLGWPALLGLTASSIVLSALPATVQGASVSLQVVNPAEGALVRISLDHRVVYEGTPSKASLGTHGVLAVVAGSFELGDGKRHVVVAEAPGTRTKTQFEWSPGQDPGRWIVIRYYPGRPEPGEPPFFTFSLQSTDYKLK